jgi:hypothetical protein
MQARCDVTRAAPTLYRMTIRDDQWGTTAEVTFTFSAEQLAEAPVSELVRLYAVRRGVSEDEAAVAVGKMRAAAAAVRSRARAAQRSGS